MAYSADVVRRARARLAEARADRESENQEHLMTAYAQLPRLQEIDAELRRSMSLAAKAAFSGGDAVFHTALPLSFSSVYHTIPGLAISTAGNLRKQENFHENYNL